MLRRLKATSKSSKMPPKSTRQDTLTYADVCWRMLNVCWTYADIKKLQDAAKIDKARYADVCWRMMTYAERMLNVCWHQKAPRCRQNRQGKIRWRMLTYADVFWTYAERMLNVCWRMLTYADMLTYAGSARAGCRSSPKDCGNRWLAERCSV
jgi:hypothetical protein